MIEEIVSIKKEDFMESVKYLIDSYVGVNGYKFGKTPSDIETEFGIADKKEEDDILEMIFETRDGVELQYHKKGRKYVLAAITILKKTSADVFIGERNVFDSMSVGASELSTDFLQGEKYDFFGKIGVSVAGYSRKKPKEGPCVIAFSKASYDIFELDGLKQ